MGSSVGTVVASVGGSVGTVVWLWLGLLAVVSSGFFPESPDPKQEFTSIMTTRAIAAIRIALISISRFTSAKNSLTDSLDTFTGWILGRGILPSRQVDSISERQISRIKLSMPAICSMDKAWRRP